MGNLKRVVVGIAKEIWNTHEGQCIILGLASILVVILSIMLCVIFPGILYIVGAVFGILIALFVAYQVGNFVLDIIR